MALVGSVTARQGEGGKAKHDPRSELGEGAKLRAEVRLKSKTE